MVEKKQCPVGEWCGLCYSNRRGRGNYKNHWGYRVPRQRKETDVAFELRRRLASGGPGADPVLDSGDALLVRYPALAAFLTATSYPDGGRRLPGSLTVFADAGCIKAALNDKDASLTAFVSASGLYALLEALERGLQSDGLDWRAAGKRTNRRS